VKLHISWALSILNHSASYLKARQLLRQWSTDNHLIDGEISDREEPLPLTLGHCSTSPRNRNV
jgi:hypothetical protein